MKIVSPAGELEAVFGNTSVEGGKVIIDAGVGIWQIKVHIGPEDLRFFLSVLFKPQVLYLILKSFLSGLISPHAASHEHDGKKDHEKREDEV